MGSVEEPTPEYDVLIIGAGLAGLYSLYRTRGYGLHVKVLEAGAGEGGTWFWHDFPNPPSTGHKANISYRNTYPGCQYAPHATSTTC
jgi:cation diffusion facilitator CzcD-associated flavoprotein CzcO